MGYSIDLRKKVIEYLARGHTMRQARDAFGIGLDTVNRWKQKFARTGDLSYPPPRRSFKKLDPEKLKAYVEERPDAYLSEIASAFGCCVSAVRKALMRLKITRKKKRKGSKSRIQSG